MILSFYLYIILYVNEKAIFFFKLIYKIVFAEQNIEIKRQWRENLNRKHFILSKAAISIYQTIQQNQFVAVFGMCGSGKSTLAQYTALRMSESHAYLVISVIASGEFPWEFPSHHCLGKPLKKILFVLDDWFGKFSISDFDHMRLSSMLNEVPQGTTTLDFYSHVDQKLLR